ncbi:unnamed protein product [Scytosiphon promiscuus]
MWKPDVVVPEHRYRARIVWAGLLLSITAYTIWQVWKIFDGLHNPSTRLEVTDEMYTYPYVLVCFFDGKGCGYSDGSTDECVADGYEYAEVYINSDDPEDGIVTESGYTNCVGLDLTKHDVAASGITRNEAYAQISMSWLTTDDASAETDYYNTVAIFVADKEPTEETLSFLDVPYTRYLPDDAQLDYTVADLHIGMTTKKDLSGDVKTSYPALTVSTATYTTDNMIDADSVSSGFDVAIGVLNLIIRQGPFSRTNIEEIDPLDIGTFLGNIGGFWELLLVFWGLIFIATRESREPKLKARDFAKSIQVGKEIITKRRSLSVDSSAPASRVEERPHWESAYRGSDPPGGGSTSGGYGAAAGIPAAQSANGGYHSASVATRRAFNMSGVGSTGGGHQQSVDVSSSSQGRPVAQDAPRRRSGSGSVPPASGASVPPSYEAMTAV